MTFDMTVRAAYLAGRGMSLREIADAMGVKNEREVQSALSLHQVSVDPRPGGMKRFDVWLSEPRQRELRIATLRRNVSPSTLLTTICRIVLEDAMIDAVIDDGKGAAP